MKNIANSIFITLIILMSVILNGQTTQLDYKQKGKTTFTITISLSDSKGNAGITPDLFISSEYIYFVIQPNEKSERTYFKEGDLKDELSTIGLFQDIKIELGQGILPIKEDDKITRILLTYTKKDVKLWLPFVFKSEIGTSEPIILNETYFDDFKLFASKYNNLLKLSKEKKYEEMLQISKEVIIEAAKSIDFEYMSFYTTLTDSLPSKAIQEPITSIKNRFQEAESKFLKSYDINDLKKLDEIINDSEILFQKVEAFCELDFVNKAGSLQLVNSTREHFATHRKASFQSFASKKIKLLETGTYDQYQFRLFVNLIQKLILQNSGFTSVKSNLSLNKSLNKDDELNLETSGWKQDFDDLIFGLTFQADSIKATYIFNEKIISNLDQQRASQPKPYYELFISANSAYAGDDTFTEKIQECINLSADYEDVEQLEIMKISYELTDEYLSESSRNNLNSGKKNLLASKWKEADFNFELAIRQNSQFAPAWFYLGFAESKLGELFSAQSRLDQSLILLPDYITPKLFSFGILKEQGDFAKILQLTKAAVAINNTYLVHLWKAEAHFMLKQYNEAVEEIKSGCLPLNQNNEAVFFLLGDIYVAMKKIDLAKEAYQKTQQINPFESALFNEKMSLLPVSK